MSRKFKEFKPFTDEDIERAQTDVDLQKEIFYHDAELLQYIAKLNPEVKQMIMDVLPSFPQLVLNINNLTEDDKFYAVSKYPEIVNMFKNPSNRLKLFAARQDWTVIINMKRPSPEVQVAAFYNAVKQKEAGEFVQYVGNFESDELETAMSRHLGRPINLDYERIISRTPSPVFSARSPIRSPRRSSRRSPKKRISPSRRRK